MPATRKLTGPRGREFWESLNLDDPDMLKAMVNTEFQPSEPANEIHYINSCDTETDTDAASNMIVSLPCLYDCLIFLYRGAILLRGQGQTPEKPRAITKTGHAYIIKDEEWIGLGKNTEILIMEQGEMKGVCSGRKEEMERQREEEARQRREAARLERELRNLRAREQYEAKMRRADSPPPIVIDYGEMQRQRRKREFKDNEKLWDKVKRKVRREPTPDPDEQRIQCAQQ